LQHTLSAQHGRTPRRTGAVEAALRNETERVGGAVEAIAAAVDGHGGRGARRPGQICMGGSELRAEANGGRWAGRGGRKQTALNNCPKLLVCVRRAAAAAARAPGWDGPDPCTQLRSTIWLAASPAVMHDPRVATYVAPFGCCMPCRHRSALFNLAAPPAVL